VDVSAREGATADHPQRHHRVTDGRSSETRFHELVDQVLRVRTPQVAQPPSAQARQEVVAQSLFIAAQHRRLVLKGFPEAIEATFPRAWVQTCIVHLIRASLRYVNYRDLKKVASALRPIYNAANADAALVELDRFKAERGARYPQR
jgi:hypothetical protein